MISKNIFLYWGGIPFSYLRYLTIYSLKKLNPDYSITLYIPKFPSSNKKTWITDEYAKQYSGKCYLDCVKSLCNVEEIDFSKIGFANTVHEVIKSDVFRNYILHKEGGLFIDTDILFFKPLPEFDCENITCYLGDLYAIGFIGAQKESKFYYDLFKTQLIQNTHAINYQDFGNRLLRDKNPNSLKAIYPNTISIDINLVYPIRWYAIKDIFINNVILNEAAIGLHWFGGSSLAADFEISMTKENWKNHTNTLSTYIGKIHA